MTDTSVEPWETKTPKKKKTGLIVGIAAAVVAVAAGVGAYFVLGASKNPDKLLADAWEKTNEAREERAAGQPLRAMGAAMEQSGGTFSGEVSALTVNGEELLDQLGIAAVSDGESVRVDLDISAEEIQGLDLGVYLGDRTMGLSSEQILGDDTFYMLDLKDPAAAARGTIFDPDTGVYPLDEASLEQLKELGELFSGDGVQTFDAEGMTKAFEDAAEIYEEFVKSVEGEKDSGKCPGSGDKATVLTYVYPAKDVIDLLEDMCNAVLDSDGFQSYLDYLTSLDATLDTADLRQALRETFLTLRRDYSGDVTVTYYIVDGEMAYLQVDCDPTYQGETLNIHADADLGLDSGELSAEVTLAADGEEICISLTSEQKEKGGVATDEWSVSVDAMGQDAFRCSGSSEWDTASGALESRFDMEAQGETLFSLRGRGVLAADKTSFALEYSDLTLTADGESLSMGLKLSYDSKASDPKPARTRDFFSLSQAEAEALVTNAMTNMGAAGELIGVLDGGTSGGYGAEGPIDGGASEWVAPAPAVSPAPGFDQLGVMTLNGEDVYAPLYLAYSHGDEERAGYMTDTFSCNVYVYRDYGDTAQENMEWTTDYWEDYGDTAEISEVLASGNKAARWMREGDYVMISTIEMRGETAVFTDIAFDLGNMTDEEITLVMELDWALEMPMSISQLLY